MEVLVSLSSYKTNEFDIDSLSSALNMAIESLSILNQSSSSTLYAVTVIKGTTYEVGTVLVYALGLVSTEYGFKYKAIKQNVSSLETAHKLMGDVWYSSEMKEVTDLSAANLEESLRRNSAIDADGVVDGSVCVAVNNQDSAEYLAVIGIRARKTFELRTISVYRIGKRFAAKASKPLAEYKALNVAKRAMNEKARTY